MTGACDDDEIVIAIIGLRVREMEKMMVKWEKEREMGEKKNRLPSIK